MAQPRGEQRAHMQRDDTCLGGVGLGAGEELGNGRTGARRPTRRHSTNDFRRVLIAVAPSRVDEHQRGLRLLRRLYVSELDEEMLGDARIGNKPPVVELVGRPPANVLVHAVLRGEHRTNAITVCSCHCSHMCHTGVLSTGRCG